MSPRITLATTRRILRQLRHDPRTIALLLFVPAVLLTLIRFVFEDATLMDGSRVFDRIGLIMLGVFPFITMFMVTSVAMLRERTTGTLERLLTTPVHKLDLLIGYGLAFAIAAAVQAVIAATLAFAVLDLQAVGSFWTVGGLAILNAVLGMATGLFASAFAKSEFQAVQFMPAFVLPQILLCGLIWPREQMADWLEKVSNVLPMTYAVDALVQVRVSTEITNQMWRDITVVVGCIVLALILGAATLRRRTD
jgi:ABC-2 type transport system permease protein